MGLQWVDSFHYLRVTDPRHWSVSRLSSSFDTLVNYVLAWGQAAPSGSAVVELE